MGSVKRMTALDICAMTKEINEILVGQKLINLYSVSGRCYLLKFSGKNDKEFLLIESGLRVHLTHYEREVDSIPNGFGMKLRKHVKNRRLTAVRQLGFDRIVDFQFGPPETASHIIVELYGTGNIILTDAQYQVISVLRQQAYGMAPLSAGATTTSTDSGTDIIVPPTGPTNSSGSLDKLSVRDTYPINSSAQLPTSISESYIHGLLTAQRDRIIQTYEKEYFEKNGVMPSKTQDFAHQSLPKDGEEDDDELDNDKNDKVKGRAPRNKTAEQQLLREQRKDEAKKLKDQKLKAKAQAKGKGSTLPTIRDVFASSVFGPQTSMHGLLRANVDVLASFGSVLAALEASLGLITEETKTIAGYDISCLPEALKEVYSSFPSPAEQDAGLNTIMSLTAALEYALELVEQVKTEKNLPAVLTYKEVIDTTESTTNNGNGENRENVTGAPAAAASPFKVYVAFAPVACLEFNVSGKTQEQLHIVETPSLWEACDIYYSSKEDERETLRVIKEKQSAVAKVARIRDDHLTKKQKLENDALSLELQASLVESCAPAVERVLKAVNDLVHSGRDWDEISTILDYEKKESLNPVAMLINSLAIAKGEITVSLSFGLEHLQRMMEKALADRNSRRIAQEMRLERQQQRLAQREAAASAQGSQDGDGDGDSDGEDDEDEDEEQNERMNEQQELDQDALTAEIEAEDDLIEAEIENDSPSSLERSNNKQKQAKFVPTPEMREPGGRFNPVKVVLHLSQSAYSNVQRIHTERKAMMRKLDATEASTAATLKAAEKRSQSEISKVKEAATRIRRKPFWFEKFRWFITSENILVVGGRDAHQNEQLVKRHLGKFDLYMHADVHGASSVIIKHPNPSAAAAAAALAAEAQSSTHTPTTMAPSIGIPSFSIAQAATFTTAHSNAWNNKVNNTKAYWVTAEQVSKTPPTGMHLPTGSFMIRGTKNYLPSQPLVMGVGLLFKSGDDETTARHNGERAPKSSVDVDEINFSLQKQNELDVAEQDQDDEDNNDEDNDVHENEDNEKDVEVNDEAEADHVNDEVDIAVDVDETTLDQDDESTQAESHRGKAILSRKDRRVIKKSNVSVESYLQHRVPTQGGDKDNDNDNDNDSKATSSEVKQSASKKPQPQPPVPSHSSKNTKAYKKKMSKYADQDEDDLAIAQTLFGIQLPSSGRKKLRNKDSDDEDQDQDHKPNGKGKNAKGKNAKANNAKESVKPAQQAQKGKQPGRGLYPNQSNAASQQQHQQSQSQPQPQVEGGEDDDVDPYLDALEFSGDSSLLNTLTGRPLPDDILTHAIAVVAPLSALNDFKYKAKLLPGTGKKGRVIKDALALFTKTASTPPSAALASNLTPEMVQNIKSANARELVLIKQMNDQEISLAMLSNCKVVASGLSAIHAKTKSDKKKAAKTRDGY